MCSFVDKGHLHKLEKGMHRALYNFQFVPAVKANPNANMHFMTLHL